MDNLKKKVVSILNKPYIPLCVSALLLCVCTDVPEHCGDRFPALNPSEQFCGQDSQPRDRCGGLAYNTSTQECYEGSVREKGSGNAAYTLSINVSPTGGGTVFRNPDKSTYAAGERVAVIAQPDSGYTFTEWSGDSTSSNPSITITMNGNKTLTANFQQLKDSPSHVHTWGDWAVTTKATCVAAGTETRTCTLGDTSETRTVAQLTGEICNPDHVHTWGGWAVTTAATCNAAGTETRKCTLGDTSETRAVSKLTGAACVAGGAVPLVGLKWMKKNLNVKTEDSWCYGEGGLVYGEKTLSSSEIQANCNKYGRLYTWEAAKSACQSVGMRLPTSEEWGALVTAAGGEETAPKKLKAMSGWDSYIDVNGKTKSGNGTDDLGFSALPGGFRIDSPLNGGIDYVHTGECGAWWAADEYSDGIHYLWFIHHNEAVYESLNSNGEEPFSFSARCVQDD
jgi:uncharacterized protein (TIGR02145 family)/uncharacterized repeat protein (TIGR02543 family)